MTKQKSTLRTKAKSFSIGASFALLVGCATSGSGGEALKDIRLGMSVDQVETLLGSPTSIKPDHLNKGDTSECRAYPYKEFRMIGITPITTEKYYRVVYVDGKVDNFRKINIPC